MKRLLTDYEIDDILSVIKPQRGIPADIAEHVRKTFQDKIRAKLITHLVYPQIIPKLKEQIERAHETTKVQAGESVGVILAQSFGQSQTQSTLNSFHKAGLSEKSLVSGIPRFKEIIETIGDPKGNTCIVKFTDHNKSFKDLRDFITHRMVEFKLKKLICKEERAGDGPKIKICLDKKDEKWYAAFEQVYGNRFRDFSHCISVWVDKKYTYEYGITLSHIAKQIEETHDDVVCVFSPESIGQIDIFLSTDSIKPDKDVPFLTGDNSVAIFMEFVAVPALREILVCGIEKITNIFFINDKVSDPLGDKVADKDQWHIETEGSNFSQILAMDGVDIVNTMTNNIWEIYNTLGVEALRQFLVEELATVVGGINPAHYKLLADKITYSGKVVSISRYTNRVEGSGALSKSTFEEPLDNLINSATRGETEMTDSVSTSIICARMAPVGTGAVDLRIDITKLMALSIEKRTHILKDVVENKI